MKQKVTYLLLLIIVLFGSYLRLTNYRNRISFGADSARDAFVAIEGANKLQLPITGPFISIAPVTTGPWYWYQLILFRLIFPGLYSPWLYLAILSILMILVMYRIGVLLESPLFGLILALVTSLSPNQIRNSVDLTNPSIVGFFTAATILLILEIIIKKRSSVWGLALGLTLGITINSHYQAVALILLPLFLLTYRKIKTFFFALLGITFTFIPLLFFDLTNHWYNVRHMLQYIRYDQYRFWTSMSWTIYLKDFWPGLWSFFTGGSILVTRIFIFIGPFVFLERLIRSPKRKILLFLSFVFLIFVIIIRYYRGERFYGYMHFFHPFIFLFTAYFLYIFFRTRLKYFLGLPIIACYMIIVWPYINPAIQENTGNTETQSLTKEILSKFGDRKYSLFVCKETHIDKSKNLGLSLYLHDKLDPNSPNKILYFYGRCSLPLVNNGNKVIDPNTQEGDHIFPKIANFYNISEASEAAILEHGGVKFTLEKEYQTMARWWMDEQP